MSGDDRKACMQPWSQSVSGWKSNKEIHFVVVLQSLFKDYDIVPQQCVTKLVTSRRRKMCQAVHLNLNPTKSHICWINNLLKGMRFLSF